MTTLELEIQEARAQDVRVDENVLAVDLTDGRTIITPLVWYPRLLYGTPQERANFEIIGDGKYIHWLDLDEDLTVAGILAGRHSNESAESLKKWLASRPSTIKQPLRQVAEKKARYRK
ncbi:MAG: DUF2442 domain-containing protein [Anaerolineales bacterium]|nr:DUF2442 domain-containing protein [Anaerolineales bacterium]